MFSRLITSMLYLTTFFLPLVFTTQNYELFEFPKFILLLISTIMIATLMLGDHLINKKNPLPTLWHQAPTLQKLLHLSVLAILVTQTIATITSIHTNTSLLGYYGRFHQGLYTTLSYTILYFTAVLYLNKKSTQNIIKISIISSFVICIYAILQRFGIDKDIWVQDVQHRVFSTLGQPNWLAAYLIPNIFLVGYSYYLKRDRGQKQPLLHFLLFVLLLTALLLTKSRSGLLAFLLSALVYCALMWRNFGLARIKASLLVATTTLFVLLFFIGTPLSAYISRFWPPSQTSTTLPAPPTLTTGGTESADIRKIVWLGALELVKKYPLLGTGPETFAYSYYHVRPIAHNYVSEWDFLYNKAHNEYLNFAANTGLLGLLAYLFFHFFALILGFQQKTKTNKKANDDNHLYLLHFYPVLAATIISFFVTNFFGFSVIAVYYLVMLLFALASTLTRPEKIEVTKKEPAAYFVFFVGILLLFFPAKLFFADLYFSFGKSLIGQNQYGEGIAYLTKATNLCSACDLYLTTLGESYATLAVAAKTNQNLYHLPADTYQQKALSLAEQLLKTNPYNLQNLKSATKIYLSLATLDRSYYQQVIETLQKARALAPTDAKLAYNQGLIYSRLDQPNEAIAALQDAITLRKIYAEAYYALTLLYEETNQQQAIPPLLQTAKDNLATYSGELAAKIKQYTSQ